MKNILIVSRSTIFHHKAGGLETQLDNLINYLKDHYNITVLTTSLPSNTNWKINQKRIKNSVEYIFLKDTVPGEYGYSLYETLFWQIPVNRKFSSFNSSFRKKSADFFKNKLKGKFPIIISQSSSAQDFDITNEKLIIINHGTTLNEIKNRYSSTGGFYFTNIKNLIRFTFLDFPLLIFEYLYNNPVLFRKAHKIVLISNRVKEDFVKQHSSFASKAAVIPNGIDTNKFKPKRKDKHFKVVYFGRIDNEKGIGNFIKVAKELPMIDFSIYGEGPDSKNLKLEIEASNLKNTYYHGAVSNDEIAKILSKSHVFLFLTKRKEGMPMSILEAMASGCAVVTTLKDVDLQDKSFYFTVQSTEEAVKIIKSLNYKKFLYLSSKARNEAIKRYSFISMGMKYKNLIKLYED